MNDIFVDTSFYIAFTSVRDALHGRALSAGNRLSGRMVTTEYVLLELANHYRTQYGRAAIHRFIAALREDSDTKIVPASTALFQEGLSLYGQRLDKQKSLTDCISFVVMRQNGLREALTQDRHFTQAGYMTLL